MRFIILTLMIMILAVSAYAGSLSCESDSDCEWKDCGCFNKDYDAGDHCVIGLEEKSCTCKNSICVPDIFLDIDQYRQDVVRGNLRRMMLNPECSYREYFFMERTSLPTSHLAVLAFGSVDNFDDTLEQQSMINADFFDPCMSLDYIYDSCASKKDCKTEFNNAIMKAKEKQKIMNTEFLEKLISNLENDVQLCEKSACEYDCTKVLEAKEKCEAQKISKEEVMEFIAKAKKAKTHPTYKASEASFDDELRIDILELIVKNNELELEKETAKRFLRLKKVFFTIKTALGFSNITNPEYKIDSINKELHKINERFYLIAEETPDKELSKILKDSW